MDPNLLIDDPEAVTKGLKLCEENGIDCFDEDVCSKTPNNIKARILFDSIHEGSTGEISELELELFLMRFGVADLTAMGMKLMAKCDDNDSGGIDLKEFEEHFSPFYDYAFESMIFLVKAATAKSDRNILLDLASDEREVGNRLKLRTEKFSTTKPSAASNSPTDFA
jgi:hypothetical protein